MKSAVEHARANLEEHGVSTLVVPTGAAAREHVLGLIPKGAGVMTMTSVTLDTIGLSDALNGPDYVSQRAVLMGLDRETHALEMQRTGAAPEWAVGSVHAVTETGQIVVASATGSQLPAYAYGALHVVWVVSTKKIVANLDAAMDRVYNVVLPLESERARKAYGVAGSSVNKLLILNREVTPGRITVVFVEEDLGF